MLTKIFRNLLYAVFAIILLQSCERDMENYPQNDETSVAKKWYEDNGKPFPLDWKKAQLINGSKSSTLVVPVQDGTILGWGYSMQQNLIFTIEGNKVASANKVSLFADTRTVAEFSEQAISNYVKKQVYRGEDLGKVYYMVYDLNDTLLYSQLMDVDGLKQVKLQLKIKDDDANTKKGNVKPDTNKNIPVVCSEWYLVQYFDDGTEYWTYLYTTCTGTASGGGGGGGGGGGSGGTSSSSFVAVAPVTTIDIEERLKCFNNVVDNANTKYKVTLNAHRIDLNSDKPGHAFLTIEKSNGTQLQRLSYGFYPQSGPSAATMQPVTSAMGEESSDYKRKSDARYALSVTKAQFDAIVSQSIALSKVPYDLNENNCTHYATDVFNLLLPSSGQLNNNGFLTPDGVYTYLANLKQGGNPNVTLGRIDPPTSTNCQ
ncbi:hypothetical protein [Sphingobacterium sp. UGAL515B_05]|uniref:hypothetical protein n=1 Tax=Sphingobacterium sp. UGAL515B_05 TaxID=2986767 RepID=UPI0029538BAF|nr:hypothetical protein [Sphingobacterium sp. UGAL515B_05]WON94349.1 hypothetical protein OK025_24280 [Sphingobacterium sp. UGAL515B_05]